MGYKLKVDKKGEREEIGRKGVLLRRNQTDASGGSGWERGDDSHDGG